MRSEPALWGMIVFTKDVIVDLGACLCGKTLRIHGCGGKILERLLDALG